MNEGEFRQREIFADPHALYTTYIDTLRIELKASDKKKKENKEARRNYGAERVDARGASTT